jgi:hypothetical protein
MLLSQAWGKACSVENGVSGFRACGLVPYNPGAIPESSYSPSDCFVVDTQQSTEESVTSAIPYFVDTAGTSSAVEHAVSEGRQYTRKKVLSSSDSTSEDESYDSASEKKVRQ